MPKYYCVLALLQKEVLDLYTQSLLRKLYPLSSLATCDVVGLSIPLLTNTSL